MRSRARRRCARSASSSGVMARPYVTWADQCSASSAGPIAQRVKRTVRPARLGAAQNGPARHAQRGVDRGEADQLPGLVVDAGPDRERVARTARAHGHGTAGPLGERRRRPVRHGPRHDGTDLRRAVGVLGTGLHPVLGIGVDEDPRLVELLVEVEDEADLDRRAVGQVDEQPVAVVVHEAVRRRPPQVAALARGHEQVLALDHDGLGRGRPPALVPRDIPQRHVLTVPHGSALSSGFASRPASRHRPTGLALATPT